MPENGRRRTCSQVHRGSDKHDTGLRRTGRLAKVAGCTGGLGPRKPPLGARANRSGLLPDRLSLTRRLHPMSRLSEPLRTTPHTQQSQLPAPLHTPTSTKKGSDPFFKGLILRTSHTPPYVDFYTGERLAMGSTAIGSAPSRVSTYGAVATGFPIASTSVACRSPVIQLIFVSRSAVPCGVLSLCFGR
jgi:hypothetical protein